MLKKLKPFIIQILIALAVGGLSALLSMGSMDFYGEINKPPLSPPSRLFPVVWTILFVLMGISAGIIVKKGERFPEKSAEALGIYYLSLFVNFFWSIIFFNLQWYLLAFLWLLLLWGLVLTTILKYRRISPLAAWLQIPYLLWITFAGYLNLMIFLLN